MTDEKNIPPSLPPEYFVPGTEEPPDAVEEKQGGVRKPAPGSGTVMFQSVADQFKD